jgi:hypothetical protein
MKQEWIAVRKLEAEALNNQSMCYMYVVFSLHTLCCVRGLSSRACCVLLHVRDLSSCICCVLLHVRDLSSSTCAVCVTCACYLFAHLLLCIAKGRRFSASRMGDYEMGQRRAQKCLEIDQENVKALFRLGLCCNERKQVMSLSRMWLFHSCCSTRRPASSSR